MTTFLLALWVAMAFDRYIAIPSTLARSSLALNS